MFGYVAAEKLLRWAITKHAADVPAEVVRHAEKVMSYCRSEHDRVVSLDTTHRAAMIEALKSRLAGAYDAVVGCMALRKRDND